MSALARRYARAAAEAADERGGNALEALAADFTAFSQALDNSSELREVLLNPAFKGERTAVLGNVLSLLKSNDVSTNVIRLLAERDRASLVRDVALELSQIVDARKGQLRAEVISAMPLSQPQLERVTKALEKRLQHPVVAQVTVDPNILGGLICKIGDLTLDSSLKRQLEILRAELESEHA